MTNHEEEVVSRINANAANPELAASAESFMIQSLRAKYSYNFSWLGRPIIQYPQDIIAMQEIIWSVKPDLIIETGIAHGGSLLFSAAMLEINAACGGISNAEVIGVDIAIRDSNRDAIRAHPLAKRITMIQGSSIDPTIVDQVRSKVKGRNQVLVCLDSNHTHAHVLNELEVYAPMTSVGSYCVVFDTIIERLPGETSNNRPWGAGNNPMTAVKDFLKKHSEFEVDRQIDNKLMISVAPSGYLRRVS